MAKGLTILLLSGSMQSMEGNVASKLAEAAINKGYKTNFYCFGEAITAVKDGQKPKRFPNLGEDLKKLAERGMKIAVCSTCSEARGVTGEEMIEGAKIGSLTREFSTYLEESDRLVTLGR
jgi:sulfur relay (sulfurtransferase) complex TusBCD TusD component (DsrE family)